MTTTSDSVEAERTAERDYPSAMPAVNHVEPVPRRIRAFLAGEPVLDTTSALYVWEWPYYPQYYIPLRDMAREVLSADGHTKATRRGTVELHTLRVGETVRPSAAQVLQGSPVEGLSGTARLDWDALDAWFEEDERVFVHPRSPYVRVDVLRSRRPVRVELEGIVLAESPAPVMLFETGLPTRYYFDRTAVDFDHLIPSDTVTECPYKGTTSQYWSIGTGETVHEDRAWSYDFPTRQVLPIAGMVSFYNEKVDLHVDGQKLPRAKTHFFPSSSDGPARNLARSPVPE
jgi:uncharacterized protein (DUF427 family)